MGDRNMANNTSPHILNASATLLGFCLFVITAMHFTDKSEASIMDEMASVIALLLTISSIFSFVSIRTKNISLEQPLEKIADYFFLFSLIGTFVILGLVLFKFII